VILFRASNKKNIAYLSFPRKRESRPIEQFQSSFCYSLFIIIEAFIGHASGFFAKFCGGGGLDSGLKAQCSVAVQSMVIASKSKKTREKKIKLRLFLVDMV